MDNIGNWLDALDLSGVVVITDGHTLKVSAAPGTLTKKTQEKIRDEKWAIMARLWLEQASGPNKYVRLRNAVKTAPTWELLSALLDQEAEPAYKAKEITQAQAEMVAGLANITSRNLKEHPLTHLI